MPGKRILLVDYDPRSLTHTRDVLQGAGFDVSTCGDGISALDQYKSLSPDLVLLSAMLPKMHGFEVCSNIRKLPGGDKTPVVIITDVYKGKRYRVDAINKYGATEYIEKPIEDANLVGILNGLVRDNGANLAIEDEERTVQFNRDLLNRMVREEVTGSTKPPSEKKTVSEKPKSKDEISKKLEQSLAGLDLDIGKKQKPKPRAESSKTDDASASALIEEAKPVDTATSPDQPDASSAPTIFTSEDLFTDVIASVERELQSEKMKAPEPDSSSAEPTVTISKADLPQAPVPSPEVPRREPDVPKPSVAPTVASAPAAPKAPEVPRAASAPTVQIKPSESHRKATFDSDLEKKLSSTLSGLRRPKTEPAAKAASASSSAKTEILSVPKMQEPARKLEPMKAQPPKVEPVAAPKPEPAPPKVEHVGVKAPIKVDQRALKEAAPAASEVAEEAGINFGQYLLLGKIATGGMAELFKAKRKGVEGFEKILAIKRILPHMSDNEEFVTMFIDEAKLAAQLTHHNICQIFDLGMIEDSYYIAMEYVHGKDLRAVLKGSRTKNKPIPVDLAVLITSKICSALDYAHRKKGPNGQPLNLVHRDVSPQNILLSYEGEVKLVDFGIAKAATKVHVTQHGALKGKLLYMSPEQAWGKTVDKRSDIFSVGILLYELLTGRPLFFDENDTEVTILEKVREAKVAPVREFNSRVPQELEKIITKTLKKNPDERYQSAYEMQRDLDNLFYSESYNATSQTLATFMRQLYPEEWAQEADVKDTQMLEREALAKPVATMEVSRPVPEPKESPAPVAVRQPEKAPVAAVPEKQPEPAPTAQPVAAPKPQGFRDISMPEIMASPEGRKLPIIPIVVAVAVIGLVVFLLFRPKQEEAPPAQPAPTVQQQTPAPSQPQPLPEQKPAVTTPQPAPPAVEEKTKAAEEEKKLAEQKAAEEQKKKEEERKKAEQAKLEEEQRLAKEKEKEKQAAEEQEEPVVEPPKMAEAQPPAQPPPQQVQETPKEAPKPQEAAPEPAPAPAQPVVQTGDLVEMTPDVTKPVVVSKRNPPYPAVAKAKKVEGTVILSLLVNESGKVSDVKVLRGAGGSSGLNEAAVASVKNWTFQPAVKEGKRVKVWVTYPIVFKLQD